MESTNESEQERCKARHPAFVMHREANIERAKKLRDVGRCGSLSDGAVYVCTLLSHTPDTNHQQQELGGKQDGLVYAEWEW